ncbi:hypothetical protein [Sphingomonas sp. ERG5]|uniref:hypothetical protein n=1 Tax=Sphingomonas sp. ERG5 TaxID=1381597 RepID=UPI000AE41CA7|nr:hypothetical protein [Sphingomonas sp. ERG5]
MSASDKKRAAPAKGPPFFYVDDGVEDIGSATFGMQRMDPKADSFTIGFRFAK